MYKFFKPLLFLLSPEAAHRLVAFLLRFLSYIPFSGPVLRAFFSYKTPELEREVMGITFKNPIGLAAGFDKNAELYNMMGNFGFGFVEIGSVTPLPQEGNPPPRCFRLPQDRALINRMGMNNKGADHVVRNLRKKPPRIVVGGNIGKNAGTPVDDAAADYENAFSLLYDSVDYFVLNISCPNVKDLVKLQEIEALSRIVGRLTRIRSRQDRYRPILLKLSPDISADHLDSLIELILSNGLDGVVLCNTTLDRSGLRTPGDALSAMGPGGLSGAPLKEKTLKMIRYVHEKTAGKLPIIGAGGIMCARDVRDMLDAGASLVQLFTGFIYEGPSVVRNILKKLSKHEKQ